MSNAVIAGKPSNTVGEKDSTLVLRGSSIKIQWGNKFIDLIKNGKINTNTDKILKTANSVEDITSDGIYLVEDSVWAVIGGTKIQLAGDSATTYVSYLVAQETTPEQKKQALTNIGFYYDTYEQAQNAGLTTGIIYVQGDNKLYVVKDGILTEYITTSTNNSSNGEIPIEELYISDFSLMVDGEQYITCDGGVVTNHKQLVLENGLMSQGASNIYGYRLYTKYGESYLEVDNLIVRNTTPDKVSIYPIKYYQEENIILSAVNSEEANQLQLVLLYSNKYNIGDILTTSILINTESEQVLVPVDFKIISSENNTYTVSVESSSFKSEMVPYLFNKSIFYKKGQLPVARIKDNNYDLFEANSEQNIEDIGTRIGNILPITIGDQNISDLTDISSGIYSNNAFLVNSKQYNTIFKNLDGTYPQYEKDWIIPDSSNDQTVVTSAWVKKQLENNGGNTGGGGTGEDYSDDIANLQEQIDILNETIINLNDTISILNNTVNILYNGDYQNPVLLMSGILYTTQEEGIQWYFTGNKKKEILNINITRIGGKIEVVISGQRTETEVNLGTEEYPDNRIYVEEQSMFITGVSANQYSSPDTISHGDEDSYKEHGNGAHWFETRHGSNTFSVREFHQDNDQNNSWRSGWNNETCRRITVNVFGYMYINKYYEQIKDDEIIEDIT